MPALFTHIIFVETIKIPTLGVMHLFSETGSYPTQPTLVQTHKREPHTQYSWFLLLSSIPVIGIFKSVLGESFSLVLLYSQLIFPRSDVVCGSWREEAVNGQGTNGYMFVSFYNTFGIKPHFSIFTILLLCMCPRSSVNSRYVCAMACVEVKGQPSTLFAIEYAVLAGLQVSEILLPPILLQNTSVCTRDACYHAWLLMGSGDSSSSPHA